MEPRISTLLDSSTPEPTTHPPRPVEPARSFTTTTTTQALPQNPVSRSRAKPGAPIAQVLNTDDPHFPAQHGSTTSLSPTSLHTSSSGLNYDTRHDDFLPPAPPEGPANDATARLKRRKHDAQPIRLPELPQLPRRTARRPRIPPLLQGLHQPPPLPPLERLFPPITGEKDVFSSPAGERGEAEWGPSVSVSMGMGVGASRDVQGVSSKEAEREEVQDVAKEVGGNDGPGEPAVRKKRLKKRTKWSEQETKDLLVGVSRYGIGSWKKILLDPELSFNGRSAVDCKSNPSYFMQPAPFSRRTMFNIRSVHSPYERYPLTILASTVKDRFRVCCPGEGLKPRKSKETDTTSKTFKSSPIKSPSHDTVSIEVPTENQNSTTHHRAELADLGIRRPFAKSNRRPRRPFSAHDDKNLLIGFEKHGPVWKVIRRDAELGFETRHPTDLRDRFRIKYPDKYAKAGYKLKPKEERIVEEQASSQQSTRDGKKGNGGEAEVYVDASKEVLQKPTLVTTTTPYIPPSSTFRTFGLAQYLSDPLPILLDDDDLAPNSSSDESPITLNRDILRWADAHPSSQQTHAQQQQQPTQGSLAPLIHDLYSTGPNTSISTTAAQPDLSLLPLFAPDDGLHINPLATLKLPPTTASSYAYSSMTMANAIPPTYLLQPVNPTPRAGTSLAFHTSSSSTATTSTSSSAMAATGGTNTGGTSNTTTAGMNSTTSAGVGSNATASASAPLTPNLPTIVYPHVPAASARSAVHNLPAPADLLLGVGIGGAEERERERVEEEGW